MSNFIESDVRQALLLPVDLREWVPEDDLSHFVLAAVERVEMEQFRYNERGTGSAQYHPRMMLALLIYSYANGVFGSRRIERATYRDIGARYISADRHPDHDTICKFRVENFEAIAQSFLQVLLLARELGVLQVGLVSVDGTKIDANASKHRSVRYDRAGALVEQLRLDIAELLKRAERADMEEGTDAQSLPEELRRREVLAEKLEAARKRLQAQASERAQRERAEYERKLAQWEGRKGKAKGKKPSKPEESPAESEQANLTDPDSALMRKNKRAEYRQSYNAQAVVDAQGSQLVLGARVSQCASDRNELVADVGTVPEAVGKPNSVLADNGFANEKEVAVLEMQNMEVLVAIGRDGRQRPYDFRPVPAAREPKVSLSAWQESMQARMQTAPARAKYRMRQQTVEPVFGIIKSILGFRQFLLRGYDKVQREWQLVCLSYNCKRLHRLKMAIAD
jgi:transposase